MNIYTEEKMSPIFEFVDRLVGIPQLERHHPEGCVLTHSMQVVDIAFRETIDTDLILAAMLHDIGKYENPKSHEKVAVEWLKPYCSVKTLWLIEHHMRIWRYLMGDMKKRSKCEYLSNHPWLMELIQLARFDKSGRVPGKKMSYDKQRIVENLNKAALKRFHP